MVNFVRAYVLVMWGMLFLILLILIGIAFKRGDWGILNLLIIIGPAWLLMYSIPVGTWIFFDSKKTFGSTNDEAVSDTGFTYMVASLAIIKIYFLKRKRFLNDTEYRRSFLEDRKRSRAALDTPLPPRTRKKFIVVLILTIAIVYALVRRYSVKIFEIFGTRVKIFGRYSEDIRDSHDCFVKNVS